MKLTMQIKNTGILLLSLFAMSAFAGENVVAKHGMLRVHGNHVVDKNNRQISLFGMSMYSSNSKWEGQKYYNEDVVKWIKKDFKATIIRTVLGVEESSGYIEDPKGNEARVKKVIEAAIANDLYVIIDFHSFQAQDYTAQAVTFFTEMARLYGKYDNVMYEIYNEPLKISWSDIVKPYSETVIAAIRAIDPDNMIIVGSPHWSQKVVEAANDPINDKNVAYTLHFYAGSHGQWLRDDAIQAMKKGIALFVTEMGTCDSSGDGGFNPAATDEWLEFCKINNLSICNWTVNDKAQTVSVIKPGANPKGGWSAADYTQSGTYVREKMRNWKIMR
jgi:endoglucanase